MNTYSCVFSYRICFKVISKYSITVTTYEHYDVSNHWQLDCFFNSLFRLWPMCELSCVAKLFHFLSLAGTLQTHVLEKWAALVDDAIIFTLNIKWVVSLKMLVTVMPKQWLYINYGVRIATSPLNSYSRMHHHIHGTVWASCQMRIITDCAWAGNAGNVFPATAG